MSRRWVIEDSPCHSNAPHDQIDTTHTDRWPSNPYPSRLTTPTTEHSIAACSLHKMIVQEKDRGNNFEWWWFAQTGKRK